MSQLQLDWPTGLGQYSDPGPVPRPIRNNLINNNDITLGFPIPLKITVHYSFTVKYISSEALLLRSFITLKQTHTHAHTEIRSVAINTFVGVLR